MGVVGRRSTSFQGDTTDAIRHDELGRTSELQHNERRATSTCKLGSKTNATYTRRKKRRARTRCSKEDGISVKQELGPTK